MIAKRQRLYSIADGRAYVWAFGQEWPNLRYGFEEFDLDGGNIANFRQMFYDYDMVYVPFEIVRVHSAP